MHPLEKLAAGWEQAEVEVEGEAVQLFAPPLAATAEVIEAFRADAGSVHQSLKGAALAVAHAARVEIGVAERTVQRLGSEHPLVKKAMELCGLGDGPASGEGADPLS